jgi:hypothetical protein
MWQVMAGFQTATWYLPHISPEEELLEEEEWLLAELDEELLE